MIKLIRNCFAYILDITEQNCYMGEKKKHLMQVKISHHLTNLVCISTLISSSLQVILLSPYAP